jgi:hypothetical protein
MVAVANKRLQGNLPTMTKFEDVQGQFNANLQIVCSQKEDGMEQVNKIFSTEDKSLFEFDYEEGPSAATVEKVGL